VKDVKTVKGVKTLKRGKVVLSLDDKSFRNETRSTAYLLVRLRLARRALMACTFGLSQFSSIGC
jgi:hypothetical protein